MPLFSQSRSTAPRKRGRAKADEHEPDAHALVSTAFLGTLRSELDEPEAIPSRLTELAAAVEAVLLRYHEGVIDEERAAHMLSGLRAVDEYGVEWTMGARSRRWYRRQPGGVWMAAPPPPSALQVAPVRQLPDFSLVDPAQPPAASTGADTGTTPDDGEKAARPAVDDPYGTGSAPAARDRFANIVTEPDTDLADEPDTEPGAEPDTEPGAGGSPEGHADGQPVEDQAPDAVELTNWEHLLAQLNAADDDGNPTP